MREIVLDTETTGLESATDRIVEIGCLELINHMPSGRTFQSYFNPQYPMSADATKITGLTDDFLQGKPLFADRVDDFLAFIGDSTLIIHNAAFDIGFLDAELARCNRPPIAPERVVDTLLLVQEKRPWAGSNSLDALCRRFDIDNSGRVVHGALLDAQLLAEVYLELRGGKQPGLFRQADKPDKAETEIANTTGAATAAMDTDMDGRGQNQSFVADDTGTRHSAKHNRSQSAADSDMPMSASPARPRPKTLPARLTGEDAQTHLAFLKAFPTAAKWLRETPEQPAKHP